MYQWKALSGWSLIFVVGSNVQNEAESNSWIPQLQRQSVKTKHWNNFNAVSQPFDIHQFFLLFYGKPFVYVLWKVAYTVGWLSCAGDLHLKSPRKISRSSPLMKALVLHAGKKETNHGFFFKTKSVQYFPVWIRLNKGGKNYK